MATQIVPFSFDGAQVRTLERDGEPWFVAKDIAIILGYTNPQKAVRDHCKAQQTLGVNVSCTLPIDPQTVIIPERDVYRLVMRSRLPAAERFEEWVVAEVLPQIRKTGSYQSAPAPQANLNDPETLQRLILVQLEERKRLEGMLHESQDHVERLVDCVVEMESDVEAYRRLAGLAGSFCLTDAAKTLKVSPRWFVSWLHANKWIYRRRMVAEWTANQAKTDSGHLTTISTPDIANVLRPQCRVTPKGMARLAKVFAELVSKDERP